MSIPDQNTQAQPNQDKEKELEKNFSVQRKHFEKELTAQRQQYEARIAQLEQERQQPQQTHDSDDDDSEPYVDQKRLKKTLAKEREELRKEFKTSVRQEAQALIEQERQSSYLKQNADFHGVMTAENIQKFAEKYPQLAEPMLEMPDGFARQKLLYEQMKALNVHKKEEPKQSIQDTVNANRRSPYYRPSDIPNAPYAMNGDFSDAGKKSAYTKMQDLIKNKRG